MSRHFFLLLIHQDYNFMSLPSGQFHHTSFGRRNLTIMESRTVGFWHHRHAWENNVPYCILRNSDFGLSFASNLKLLILRLRFCCLVESHWCWFFFKGMERFYHIHNTHSLTKILAFVGRTFRQIITSVFFWKMQYCTAVSG